MNVRLLLKRYQCATAFEENVQLIFFLCVAASGNISLFFKERAAASEKYYRLLLKEKNVQLRLKIVPT